MPDPAYIALAASLAGITAAVVLALAGLPWKAPRPQRLAIGTVLGVGLGFAVGCGVSQVKPDWPLIEDQDRFLGLILPAVLIVEVIAAAGSPAWLARILRIVVACTVPRVLLHGTVYLDEPSGDGGLAWTPAMRWTLLPGLTVALIAVWGLFVRGNRQQVTRAVPLALGLTCCAAGLTVMMSGYATGGQLGPILGGAIIGAVVGSLLSVAGSHFEGAIGFSLVGLFGLLVIGRFFGELTNLHAVLLLLAPLLSLLPLSRWMHRWPNWAIATAKLVLVLLPLSIVLGLAVRQFVRNSQPATTTDDSGASAYENYGS